MKKKQFVVGALVALFVIGLAAVGFADDVTFNSPPVIVEKPLVAGGGGALGGIVETIILAVISALGALIAYGVKFLRAKLEGSKTRNVLRIASAAVHYAEQKWGSDTQKGKEKKEEAVAFVMQHFKGVSRDQAEKFVGAAYSAIFTGVAPLGTSPAPKV